MLIAVLGHRGMLGRRVLEAFPDALIFDERYTGELHDPLLDAIEAPLLPFRPLLLPPWKRKGSRLGSHPH